jgi:hypothetical protein
MVNEISTLIHGGARGGLKDQLWPRCRHGSEFIRQSLILVREGDQAESSARADVAMLLRVAAEASLDGAASAIPQLEQMLDDEAFVEIGVAGPLECAGKLVHWRHERCSPRRAAVHALSALGRVPHGDRMLAAMLAEAVHAQAICNTLAEPPRFTVAQWRSAVAAAGGLIIAEPRIRGARQQCLRGPWPGHTGPHACEAALAEVLSGRLGP